MLSLIVVAVLSASTSTTPRTLHSGHHFLPPYPNARDRFGFDSGPVTPFDVAQLNAGWYSNWGASLNPAHPDGLTYVQLIRFHAGSDAHDPTQVTVKPDRDTIAQIAALHPGSLWFMSNEPDSLYQGDPIYPDVYAHVYHEFYHYIKGLDPSALIANGGIVQPTPCRMEYLDIVWNTYQQAYSETMPVDVWNIHAFVLREVYGSWGASTPPGVDRSCAMNYAIRDGDDIGIFRDNLIAFRGWMKEKGEQDKPLIISEYGVLWPSWLDDEDGNGFPPARVSHFMTQTFDLFLNETYTDVGYPEDDYRLVQAWAWYSLSDDQHYNGYLFHNSSRQISAMGQTYADYVSALTDTQYSDLVAQLWVDLDPLRYMPYASPSVTLPVTGVVVNLGNAPASGVIITSPLLGVQATQDFAARYEGDIGALPLPALVLTQSGVYDLALIADPERQTADPRRWNNTSTITVDARPDLLISATTWHMQPAWTLSVGLNIALTATNKGLWPSPPISGALYLSDTRNILLLPGQRFPIPALGVGDRAAITKEINLFSLDSDYLYLAVEVDSDENVDEQDEGNNRAETNIPIVVTTTLQPNESAVLTSASGQLAFMFPAGMVTEPTEIRFTPRLISDLPPGPPLGIAAFKLSAYRGGHPVSLTLPFPITVTWHYTDIAGLDDDALNLYRLAENERWRRVFCLNQQHLPEVNHLQACVPQLGEYVFGQGYELYIPLYIIPIQESVSEKNVFAPGMVIPGAPLRLPQRLADR